MLYKIACNFIKKKDHGTGVFLRILQSFKNTFFHRTHPVAVSVCFTQTVFPFWICDIQRKWANNVQQSDTVKTLAFEEPCNDTIGILYACLLQLEY